MGQVIHSYVRSTIIITVVLFILSVIFLFCPVTFRSTLLILFVNLCLLYRLFRFFKCTVSAHTPVYISAFASDRASCSLVHSDPSFIIYRIRTRYQIVRAFPPIYLISHQKKQANAKYDLSQWKGEQRSNTVSLLQSP